MGWGEGWGFSRSKYLIRATPSNGGRSPPPARLKFHSALDSDLDTALSISPCSAACRRWIAVVRSLFAPKTALRSAITAGFSGLLFGGRWGRHRLTESRRHSVECAGAGISFPLSHPPRLQDSVGASEHQLAYIPIASPNWNLSSLLPAPRRNTRYWQWRRLSSGEVLPPELRAPRMDEEGSQVHHHATARPHDTQSELASATPSSA